MITMSRKKRPRSQKGGQVGAYVSDLDVLRQEDAEARARYDEWHDGLRREIKRENEQNGKYFEDTLNWAKDIIQHDEAPNISGGVATLLTGSTRAGRAVGAIHRGINSYFKGDKKYRRAEILKGAIPKFAQALGSRNIKKPPSQKAIQSIKNKSARQRKPKQAKVARIKHTKKATHKRGKENAAYAAKHIGKPPRSAQFYRDNGLPVPPGAQ